MQKKAFGVDIGGTSCKIGLFDIQGNLLEKWEIPTARENQGTGVLERIATELERKMKEKEIRPDEILGVGLDVPGIVKEDGLVEVCVNLGWRNYRAAEILAERLGKRVVIGNDANAAALGELWKGGGKGSRNMVMVTLGTGVGGAVILNGKIISGAHGIAGELGHITVNRQETDVCACGKCGCLEQYASASGIVRVTKKLIEKSGDKTALEKESVSAKSIFDAAKDGDELALEAVEILGKHLGHVLAQTSGVIDPQVYVIGGGVSRAGQILIDVIQKYFIQEVLSGGKDTKFSLASLGNDAGMYGCVKMLLD